MKDFMKKIIIITLILVFNTECAKQFSAGYTRNVQPNNNKKQSPNNREIMKCTQCMCAYGAVTAGTTALCVCAGMSVQTACTCSIPVAAMSIYCAKKIINTQPKA